MVDPELIVKIAAPTAGGGFALYRLFLHHRLARMVARRKQRDSDISQIPRVLQEIQSVKNELRTNGGTSLRDEIRKLGTKAALAEQQIRALLQAATSEAVFETNVAGEWVWGNRALVNLSGRTSEELFGNGWINIIDPMDRAATVEEWRHSIRDKRECIVRFRMTTRAMRSLWVTMHGFPMRGAYLEEVVGYFGIIVMDKGGSTE